MRQLTNAIQGGERRWRLLVSTLLVALTVGCGRGDATTATVRERKPLPAEPRVKTVGTVGAYGGRFVIGETSAPKTFNILMANEASSTDLGYNILFISLASFNNDTQQLEPALAKSWSVADDKLTWTFNLRRGAQFSDGQPITSADVLFTFQVALDDTVHPSVQDLLVMNGKKFDVSAPDAYTVVIKTPEPNAMLVPLVGSVYIMPKHVLEPRFKDGTFASAYAVSTLPQDLVTSGPFKLKQYVAGDRTVLEPNPYWYGVDQSSNRLPYLDELVFLVVPDQDAADLKFRAGELDALDNVKPENYSWYGDNQAAGNFTLHNLGAALSSNYINFNLAPVRKPSAGKTLGEPHVGAVKYAWFSNPVFRRAVSMAIDREAMIPSIFFGDAVKNWSTQTAANKTWYSPDVTKFDYNVAESKRLLASLGWKDGDGDGVIEDAKGNPVSFTLKTNSDNVMRVSMANFVRDDLAKVGIKLTLVPIDFNTLITNIRDDFQYDTFLLGLQSGVPPDPALGQNVYRSSGRTHQWNPGQPKPETPQEARIDSLMDIIVGNPELAARQTAWREVENIINEQSWLIWLPTPIVKLPVSNRFGNIKPSVIPHRLLWNIDEVYLKARTN